MRLRIRTNCLVCIVSSIALVISVLSSPIRSPQISHLRVKSTVLSRNYALASKPSGQALTSATTRREVVDADGSDIDEEDEDESSRSFSHDGCPTFVLSDSPSNLLSLPRPGNSPPRTAVVPLRC